MIVRRLTPEDAPAYFDHRREALANEPFAFSASPEDDLASSVAAVAKMLDDAQTSAVFGAFDPQLVGSIGVYRDPKRKHAHKAHVWGFYVSPAARHRGIGKQLLRTAVAHARGLEGILQLHLSVTDRASVAQRLYEDAGFRIWGTEPRSVQHSGEWASEHHFVLQLDSAGAAEAFRSAGD